MIEATGLTTNAFAATLEDVSPNQLYNIINGRNAPSFGLLVKIAERHPEVNMMYLLLGEGPVFIGHEQKREDAEIMDKIRRLEEQIEQIRLHNDRMNSTLVPHFTYLVKN